MTRTLTFGFLTLNVLPEGNVTATETIRAAAEAGFESVGLRYTSRHVDAPYVEDLTAPAAFADLRNVLAQTGIRLSNTLGYGFFPDIPFDAHRRVIEMSAETGSPILVGNFYDEDESRLADTLGRFASEAADAGIRVVAEQMPFSAVRTVVQLKRLVDRAGAADNLGFMIDALHLHRSGGNAADIAMLDPGKIFMAQLCDAPPRPAPPDTEELRREARSDRYYPGKGDLPLYDFLDALPAGIEIEFEVPRPDESHLTPAQRARKAHAAFTAFMAGYAVSRGAGPEVRGDALADVGRRPAGRQ